MNKVELVRIARTVVARGKIDKAIAGELISKLTRKDLAHFARILARLVNERTVKVISQEPLSVDLKKEIEKKFEEKDVVFLQEKIGDGIKIIINDTIIDLTIGSFINSTIENLKSEI